MSVGGIATQANGPSTLPAVNADGNFVVFSSTASNLVTPVTNGTSRHIFLRDRAAGTTTLISQSASGNQGNGDSDCPVISADGRTIAFHTEATNLGPGDGNGFTDVYLLDRVAGMMTLVSSGGGGGGNGQSVCPGISIDGRWVAFYSGASNQVPNDTNMVGDAFVFDRLAAVPMRRVSIGVGGVQGNDFSQPFSPFTNNQIAVASHARETDHCFVAFQSLATNLVSGATDPDGSIYVRDTFLAATSLVSASTAGEQGQATSRFLSMSSDARYVVFNSDSNNLVPGDTSATDTFLRDVQASSTTRVSVSSRNAQGTGSGLSLAPHGLSMTADGRYVVFESAYTNLVPNDTDGTNSIFVRDTTSGLTWRVSLDPIGGQPDDDCTAPWISGDGTTVVFASEATDLVPLDTNAVADIFLETFRSTTSGFCFGGAAGIGCPCANNGAPEKGCENSVTTGGALLLGVGTTSVANDTFVLAASTMVSNSSVLYYQSPGPSVITFGDGIRCGASPIIRLATRTTDGVGSRSLGFGITGDAPISVLGSVPSSGATKAYQAWYRNAATFCTSATFNLSNGLSVVWTP